MEFQVRYLALFTLFTVIGSFGWSWMGSLHKNIQLMLVFLKVLFLVLHFSYYTLMTFLTMLLLSMLMILLSTLNVMGCLICGNNQNWLYLIYKTLWTAAGSGLLFSRLEKISWFCLAILITLVLLMGKWMGFFLGSQLLLGIVRKAAKIDLQGCCSFT